MNLDFGKVIPMNKRNPTDYFGEDGMPYCGKCHEPKRMKITIQGMERVVPVMCSCRHEELIEEHRRQKREEALRRVEKIRRASMMDGRYKDNRFESWDITDDNLKPLQICRRYVKNFDVMKENSQGLLLYGPVGTGKTYAASCIANELIIRNNIVVMTSFVRLLGMFDGKSQDDIESRMNVADLLIIDDLGAERSTDYALERVYSFIDSRYRSGKPIILTTNLNVSNMQISNDIRYTRIYDRIFEMCYPVKFSGQSHRKIEAAQRAERMKKILEGALDEQR